MHPKYQQASFLKSAAKASQLPPDAGLEVAFAGRSNAGKSSAINALCGQKALARTSKTPGRTQLINVFDLPEGRRLIDLPGYGFAKVPESVRRQWGRMIEEYLNQRQSLAGLVLIMDVRHPLTDHDRQMLAWCTHRRLPVHCLLTKADKLKRGAAASTLLALRRQLPALHAGAGVQLFSSLKHSGVER